MGRGTLLAVMLVALAGCESTHQNLVSNGYPPAFADGFDAGCSSGRQAAGVISGEFRKDVPRYLKDPTYAQGWDDGFGQCKSLRESEERDDYRGRHWDQRERDWQHEKSQGAARTYRPD